jgi:methylenetetrahydrofolate reductase (NADPH)
MKILDTIRDEKLSMSFEVFPPKTDAAFEEVLQATEAIAALKPSFISVTYGAGGKGGKYTMEIARRLQNADGGETLAHLTCVGAKREDVQAYLQAMKDAGIRNIMALRGDLPEGMNPEDMKNSPYPHASDLIREIRATGDFCIGAACYPEVHPESTVQAEDLRRLKEKVEAGADFLTTQMFFENAKLYEFLELAHKAGISVPIIAGIMPITKKNQLERSVSLSGTSVPHALSELISKYGDDPSEMKKAGIDYACGQIEDLINNGVNNIHIYSMNRPGTAGIINSFIKRMIKG